MFAEEILTRRSEVREGINISSRPSFLRVKIKIRVLSGNYAEHSYALTIRDKTFRACYGIHMRPRWILFFSHLILLLFPLTAPAQSGIVIGARSVSVKDSIINLTSLAGKPKIEVYLLNRELPVNVKNKLLANRPLSEAHIIEVVGEVPLLKLDFLFENGATTCNDRTLISYSATFRAGTGSPFNIPGDKPISFTYTKPPKGGGWSMGINSLFCAIEAKSTIILDITGSKLVENHSSYTGKTSIPFSWRIKLKGIIG